MSATVIVCVCVCARMYDTDQCCTHLNSLWFYSWGGGGGRGEEGFVFLYGSFVWVVELCSTCV